MTLERLIGERTPQVEQLDTSFPYLRSEWARFTRIDRFPDKTAETFPES